jgi:hypothetical protein
MLLNGVKRWVRGCESRGRRNGRSARADEQKYRPNFETLEERLAPSVSFGTPTNFAVPRAHQVVTADFNNDGLSDMVVVAPQDVSSDGNTSPGGLTVLMNDRNHPGQFKQSYHCEINDPADNGVVVGRFHQDSPNLDIAFLDRSGNSVSMLRGSGDGTFVSEGSYTATPRDSGFGATAYPTCLVAGDFYGDGKLDIAVGRGRRSGAPFYGYACGIYTLRGNGDGTFQYPTSAYEYGIMNPLAMVTADFNGDGKLDIAVADHADYVGSRVLILHGNGDGTFEHVYMDDQRVWETTATAVPIPEFSSHAPNPLAIGDFDRDGQPDLAVATDEGVTVLLANDLHHWYTYGTDAYLPTALTVGDFNGDGKTDIAFADQEGVKMLEAADPANPYGLFYDSFMIAPRATSGGGTDSSLAVGYFNGDNAPDLAYTNDDGLAVALNQPPVTSLVVKPLNGFDTGAPGTFSGVVTAYDNFGDRVPYYTGTVHFTSTDPRALLPADYQFTSSDAGSHVFAFQLHTAGTQSVTAIDVAHPQIDPNWNASHLLSEQIPIIQYVSATFTVLGTITLQAPDTVFVGQRFSVTVTVMDASGTQPDASYRGTIILFSTDPTAQLPLPYRFTAADHGVHTFTGLILNFDPSVYTGPGIDPALSLFAAGTAKWWAVGYFYGGSTAIDVDAAPTRAILRSSPLSDFYATDTAKKMLGGVDLFPVHTLVDNAAGANALQRMVPRFPTVKSEPVQVILPVEKAKLPLSGTTFLPVSTALPIDKATAIVNQPLSTDLAARQIVRVPAAHKARPQAARADALAERRLNKPSHWDYIFDPDLPIG